MSDAEICNQALGRLGETQIFALTDSTQAARACNTFYELTRDEMLRAADWNFARRRAQLTQIAEAPAFGWSYQYVLPVDCLHVRRVNAWQADEARQPWEIEGRNLLTDLDAVQISYTARITDSQQFDSLFVEAFALKLAHKIAVPLTSSSTMAQGFLEEYERLAIGRAKTNDAGERRDKCKPAWVESPLVQARGVGSLHYFPTVAE